MIELIYHNGITLLFSVSDWYELRTKYRIIGEFFGSSKSLSTALPVALSPEETYLLLKNGIAKLVKWNDMYAEPTTVDQNAFQNELENLFQDQKVLLLEERKNEIENVIEKILIGKRKQGKEISRENIIDEELSKLPEFKKDNTITQVYVKHPEFIRGESCDINISEIFEHVNEVKYAVYEDLWTKGFYITAARKFGGDFLVYLGDPILFHAVYIIKCVENKQQPINVIDLVAYGRLGNSVKKKFVLASVDGNEHVSYITLSWMDT